MARAALLRITVEPLDDARVIRPAGEIDVSTITKLRRELDAAREEAPTTLLDLSDVTFMDSTGLHLLLKASRESPDGQGAFFILHPSPVVQRLIDLSGTASLLRFADPAVEEVVG